jgi:ankyrin repeat protein
MNKNLCSIAVYLKIGLIFSSLSHASGEIPERSNLGCLQSLPDEILIEISSYLTSLKDQSALGRTCEYAQHLVPSSEELLHTELNRVMASNPKNTHLVTLAALAKNDINARDKFGWTLLHHAVEAIDKRLVAILLANHANPNAQDRWGNTPLYFAAQIDTGHYNDFDPLPKIQNELTSIVNQLLKSGANPNLTTAGGNSPLFPAVSMGHTEVILQLLKAGANVDMQAEDGRTPLFMSTAYGPKLSNTELLLKWGASTRVLNNEGLSASQYLRKHACTERVAELVEKYETEELKQDEQSRHEAELLQLEFSQSAYNFTGYIRFGTDVQTASKIMKVLNYDRTAYSYAKKAISELSYTAEEYLEKLKTKPLNLLYGLKYLPDQFLPNLN